MKRPALGAAVWWGLGIPLAAVALALATASVLLLLAGSDPLAAYRSMADAAFGSAFAVGTTIVKTIPRLLPALGIALALRAGLWNIGAEGQIYLGAVAGAGVALFGPNLGFPAGTALALGAAAAAGGLWAALPGMLRAYRGISEVITSLMLVYVAIQLTNYLVEGPWLAPNSTFPATAMVPQGIRLPIVWPGTLVNAGVLVAVLAVGATWFLVTRTTFGMRLRAVGGNERAAKVAGVRVTGMIVVVMAVSGAFAGLAGGIEVLGVRGRLLEGFSPGYGFEAIAIALLGRLSPVGVLGAALLFGALDAGGAGLRTAAAGAPAAIVPVVEGLAVIYVMIGLGIVEITSQRRRARDALRSSRVEERPATSPEAVSG